VCPRGDTRTAGYSAINECGRAEARSPPRRALRHHGDPGKINSRRHQRLSAAKWGSPRRLARRAPRLGLNPSPKDGVRRAWLSRGWKAVGRETLWRKTGADVIVNGPCAGMARHRHPPSRRTLGRAGDRPPPKRPVAMGDRRGGRRRSSRGRDDFFFGIVIPLYLIVWSMIFSEKPFFPLFGGSCSSPFGGTTPVLKRRIKPIMLDAPVGRGRKNRTWFPCRNASSHRRSQSYTREFVVPRSFDLRTPRRFSPSGLTITLAGHAVMAVLDAAPWPPATTPGGVLIGGGLPRKGFVGWNMRLGEALVAVLRGWTDGRLLKTEHHHLDALQGRGRENVSRAKRRSFCRCTWPKHAVQHAPRRKKPRFAGLENSAFSRCW